MEENQKIKRYLLFAFNDHYPRGGMDDLRYSSDSLEEIAKILTDIYPRDVENIDVFDCKEQEILATFGLGKINVKDKKFEKFYVKAIKEFQKNEQE